MDLIFEIIALLSIYLIFIDILDYYVSKDLYQMQEINDLRKDV